MGKMSLGLDDRSARLLHGRDVWSEIKDLLSGYNDIQAAIAYIGSDGDQYLPLRGPATVVVNAGDEALRNGWTDPAVLLRWTRRGVRVHSLPSLHAKVLVAQGSPSFVLVGSADVLSASGRPLDEAVLIADEKQTVDEMRDAVTAWREQAGEPLTDAWLQAAFARYRPPGAVRRPAAESSGPVAAPVAVPVAAPVEAARPPAPALRSVDPPTAAAPVAVLDPLAAAAAPADRRVFPPVPWPRPKFIYLATLTRDGRASAAAVERLDQLRREFRVPAGDVDPVLEVEMFWWDAPARSSGRAGTTYREGWHVVPISVPASGRPAVLTPVHSPGQVLHSFTEYLAGPGRTYYYLLIHTAGPPVSFRKLREALTAVGEKPSYDHAYMMQHKVAAILDLWPDIAYQA